MKRILTVIGAGLGLLLLGVVTFFFWASAGRLSADERAQTKRYAPPAATAPDTVTVTTYNIGYLSGMTNNQPVVRPDSLFSANMEQALRLLRGADADLIGFQEIDYGGARVNHVHQLDTIATELTYATAAQAVNWDKRYLPFPYGRPAVHFGRTLSGQAVLSRFPVRQHLRVALARPPLPFLRDAFYLDRLAQIAVVDLGGRPLAVMNLHLEAFDAATRQQQAREANALYDRLTAAGLPVLVLGDLNSVAPAARSFLPLGPQRTFADDDTLPILLDGTDLHPVVPDSAYGPDAALGTYPADAPTRPIDHIFYPPALFEPVAREIQCGAPSPPSDHCAVTASLRLRSSPADWPAPDPTPRLDTLLAD
jgi:endonuclease/exonuclease/phosphatase family metal-dependent hydrolase